MKKLTLLLISLLVSAFAFTQNCNSETKNTNLAASLAYGQQTNDYDCWRQDANTAISRLVALLQQSNPTTTILDIAQNSDLTLDQRLDQICDIFSGLSKDPFQTNLPQRFRLDANLQGTGIVFCEAIRGLVKENDDIDNYHFVGDPITGLGTTFSNLWTTDNKGPLKFTKDQEGTVFVTGQISLIGSGNGGSTVTKLPIDYRPFDKAVSDIAFDFVSGNIAQVFISPNGNMSVDFGGINPNLVLNFSFHP